MGEGEGWGSGLHLDLGEEAVGDGDERLLRPREEPVDARAVGERGEAAAARAELLAHGRHAAHDVHEPPHLADEELPERLLRVHVARGLGGVAHAVGDVVLVLGVEQVRGHAAREDVVEVDEGGLLVRGRVRGLGLGFALGIGLGIGIG